MNIDLKVAGSEDESFLTELFFDVRGRDFAVLPPDVARPLIAMQQRAQLLAYAEQFPAAVNEIVWIDGARAGRFLVNSTAEGIRLVDVALLSRFRGQGVGTKLLGDLCRRARAEKLPLRLSVMASNPAYRLYARLGFVPTGSDSIYIAMELGAETPAMLETAGAPAGDAAGMDSASGAVAEPVAAEPGLTQAYFRTLQGRRVQARSLGGVQVELLVSLVEPLMAARGQRLEMGDSFRVEFLGPLEPVLPSEMVEIAADGDAPQEVFVSPLGPEDGAMQYESIFNRARLPS
jgi:ribosomal protein S18 acetylase RimI-like enzyme